MIKPLLLPFFLLLSFVLPIQAVAQGEVNRAEYRLATGDTIYVRVYGEDDLTMRLAVPSDGAAHYAFVGKIQLAGKTVDDLEQEITRRLKGDYLIDPRVSVTMAEFRDFYIQGEVARIGGFPWQPGLTVRTAISLAGGLRERASGSKWYVVPEGGSEDDRRRVSEDDIINPGDTLIVEQSFF
ncbi:polysaccharide biosynthesis/export family protein [Pseudomonadota bacterium]